MKCESRKLFQQLGPFRDTQVMVEWVRQLAPVPDATFFLLRAFLEDQERRQREEAAEAVLEFNHKKWRSWMRLLFGRTKIIRLGSIAFRHLALERWSDVHELYRQATQNRTQAAYHRLQIALKMFRYTIENLSPARHEQWGAELRKLQDLQGEIPDLDVLW
jgi:CHAD domain-containing protein